jgi:hypothetical protein
MDYEAGPIEPLDPARLPRPPAERSLEGFMAERLAPVVGHDVPLGAARELVAGGLSDRSFEDAYEAEIAPAAREIDGQLDSWHIVEPEGLVETTQSAGSAIDAEEREYPDPDAPDVEDYDPGPDPEDGGPGGGGPPPEV